MIAILLLVISTVAVIAEGATPPFLKQRSAAAAARGLEDQAYADNYNYYPYQDNDEYANAKMAGLTFSFTGCSVREETTGGANNNNNYNNNRNGQNNINYAAATYHKPFVTYRLCDSCSSWVPYGCGNGNGDYITSVGRFGEAYSQYLEKQAEQQQQNQYNNGNNNGQNNNNNNNIDLFECTSVNEYLNQQNQQDQEEGGENEQQQQQQQQQFYVGPACLGNGITLAVFYDNACSYLAENMSVREVLGYKPNTSSLHPRGCISCNLSQESNDYGGQAVELNPLCWDLLERSGRCDRDPAVSAFDQVWQDVVDSLAGDDEEEEGQNDNQYNNQNNNNNQYTQYYDYLGQNACEFVDSLQHTPNTWASLKKAAEDRGLSAGALACIIVASVSVAAITITALCFHFCGCDRGRCSEREPFLDGSEYHRSEGTQA